MWKYASLFCFIFFLASCGGENTPHENSDSLHDTTSTISVPQFDISGELEVLMMHSQNQVSDEDGMRLLTASDVQETDSLWILYKAVNPCEECHLEYQIWRNDKYVEVVRDTGFGVGGKYIPASLLLEASKFGTPEYERLSVYLSVRQYHPVETGNKRFLFYLDLK
jgi:hypothetical protein